MARKRDMYGRRYQAGRGVLECGHTTSTVAGERLYVCRKPGCSGRRARRLVRVLRDAR